jgi:hypothetical protein
MAVLVALDTGIGQFDRASWLLPRTHNKGLVAKPGVSRKAFEGIGEIRRRSGHVVKHARLAEVAFGCKR